ncbi:WecB/TagA/CpsF family glycosyltransferase [Ligilactobacillus animalis]|uniref:WecB/TagA/CpsF family glycosyltransferase n=1 Tax=Ligilactobacillus animalis TaxID=1605 RepID=UPI001C0FE7DF|nr:WecB/TagA/CpsF family glycosyltransferase [Ligilactobacillus animalis]MBU5279675.1 WecB/TagA/CpsF family glycosyltransferase [Ligilactobacillus animalis]
MQNNFETVNVLGLDFIKATQAEFLEQLKRDSQTKDDRFIVTANPEIVLAAKDDTAYAKTIRSADYITADGIGIIKGAKILGDPLPERVTGYDTLVALLAFANDHQKSVFFLGAKPDVLEKVLAKVKTSYPDLKIAGSCDGYFKDEAKVARQIEQARPDFVFVALGFPKQEFFIAKHRELAPAIWMGVGGSFDVLSGQTKRAPKWWIDHHLEWAYRLLKEPSRFIRMLALPKYLLLVYRKKIFGR